MGVDAQMIIAILTSSLPNRNANSSIIASLSTLQEEMSTKQYVTIVLIEGQKRRHLNERSIVVKPSAEQGKLAPIWKNRNVVNKDDKTRC